MTLGGSAHWAPLGIGGSSTNGLTGSGTNAEKATCLPSGDQASPPGDDSRSQTFASAPPSSQRHTSSTRSPACDTNTTRLPSGDQRGIDASRLPLLNAR